MATRTVLGIPVGKKKSRIAKLVSGNRKGGGLTSALTGGKNGPNLGSWARGAAVLAGGAYAASRAVRGVRKGKSAVDNVSKAGQKVSEVSGQAQEKLSGGPLSALRGGKNGGGNGDGPEGHVQKFAYIIAEQIEVGVNRRECYNQWTQFKEYSEIFLTVERVDHPDDEEDKTSWAVKFGPARRQWVAEITEQIPDRRIAWRAESGANLQGVVTFHELDENLTRVQVQTVYRPQGFLEHIANWFRWVRVRVRRDLRLFKNYMELRAEATGEWRGEIDKEEGSGEAAIQGGDSESQSDDGESENGRSQPQSSGDRSSETSRSSSGRSSASRKSTSGKSTASRSS
jgi:uncharacterized membrane protein